MSDVLSEHLLLLSTAPGGIQKLRALILDLAVRGKLVPQDPNDEPASELLERIAHDRAGLEAEGAYKKMKALPAVSEDEQLFSIPDSWRFSRLGELCLQVTDGTHHTPTYLSTGIPFISVKDIDGATVSFDNCKYISEEEHQQINQRCNPEKGDILLCRIGTLGRPTIVNTDRPFSLFVSVGLVKLPKTIDFSRYLHLVMASPCLTRQYDQIKAGGSHTNKLNLGDIPKLLVPLAPLAEQRRIVAKVDELMALCDRLEAELADVESAHAQLVNTLLGTLTQSTDATDLTASWHRLVEHFHSLFTTESSLDALKQTILQLAVMGKLVPQDPKDVPASELLKRITQERAELEAKAICKKSKPMSPLGADEQLYDIPATWLWCRLGDMVIESGAGWSPSCESRPRQHDEWGVLKVSAVSWGAFNPDENKALPSNLAPRPEHEVASGDFLVSRANTAELVARSVVIEQCPSRLMLSDKIVRLKLTSLIDARFINLANSCEQARSYYAAVAGGTSASMKNVSRDQILNLVIPLPPIAEQRRIVAKVDELMDLCNHIKADLVDSRRRQERLASTLIESALKAA